MPWFPSWWSSISSNTNEEKQKKHENDDNVLSTQLREAAKTIVNSTTKATNTDAETVSSQLRVFAAPQTVIATAVLTTACLGFFRFYKTYLRRIPEAANIRPSFFRSRSILGKVTSVGDGDNFRIYHTPGGWLAGWGWLPWRRVPQDRKELKNQTVHIRIAGVDAPELSHFGRPAQPYAQEALDWLTSYLQGRRVRAYLHKADQYSRAVATVYVWKGFLRRDVGLQMLRAGLATVYEAKSGAEFGKGLEQKYRNAEWWAKTKRKGMWAASKSTFESPREYKTRYGTGASGGS